MNISEFKAAVGRPKIAAEAILEKQTISGTSDLIRQLNLMEA